MKLIMLYGPPAVGKLTVANELQKLTGFKLLHNHQVSDLVMTVHERGTLEAAQLNHQLRLAVYKDAVARNIPGMISTVLYRYDIKDQVHAAVRDYVALTSVVAVRLSCAMAVLEERVASEDRQGTKKINSVKQLRSVLAREDLMRELPLEIVPSLHIDTTRLSPQEVAQRIYDYIS